MYRNPRDNKPDYQRFKSLFLKEMLTKQLLFCIFAFQFNRFI